jgi:hypothetical protein
MRYTMVKQFSNGVIDNIFSFFFKWADCGKMFLEFLWSFIEIWIALFLIFYNAFMYVYYLFLFFIDRGTESSAGMFRIRGMPGKTSSIPKFEISRGPTTIPPQYGRQAVASAAVKTTGAAAPFTSLRTSASAGIKKSPIKVLFASLVDFFKFLARIVVAPFKKLVLLFDRGVELRKQREAEKDKSKSIIDDYIKEYEHKRR